LFRNSPVLGPIKKVIFIIITGIFLILFCFIYLHTRSTNRAYEDKLIINAFGKQRMYTQMISKDASRLYALMQSKETNYAFQSDEIIENKINIVKESLADTSESFEDTIEAIHNHEIYINSHAIHINASIINASESLNKIDLLWEDFDKAIEVLIKAEKIDSTMADAAIYINENNLQLLEQCDNLLNQILEASLKKDRTTQSLAFGMIGLLFITIVVSLIQLQRYLIQPFSQLYKGIADIGLNSYPLKTSFPTKKKMAPIVSEINQMFLKINHLISLIENINTNASFMQTLNFISNTFSVFIPYNYIGIALISEDKKYLKATYGVSDGTIIGLPEKIRGASWLIGETSLEALIHSGEVRIINDLEEYCKGKPLKTYNKVLLEAGIRSSITLPLKVSKEPVGMIFFSSGRKNVYTKEHINILGTLANSIAICLNQNIFVNDIIYSSILALAKLAEARDEDTGEHLDRMSVYSRVIAELLYENGVYSDELTLEFIDNLERFSPLHDIGKVGIRDDILLKPGKLSTEEFDEMKRHTTYGAEVLKSADSNLKKKGRAMFSMGQEIAEGHHEKWDGSGYPKGISGVEIPLSARIVAVADVFDALTSKRPYKEPFSFDLTIDILRQGREKQFDPAILDVFMDNMDRIELIYKKFKTADTEMIAEMTIL
jgi:HD-GYP domain-containing protein (c-di-GMP phosphodiesterase class II)